MSGETHVVEPVDQLRPGVGVHQTREVDIVPLLNPLQLQRLPQLDGDPGPVCTHQVTAAVLSGKESRKRTSAEFKDYFDS